MDQANKLRDIIRLKNEREKLEEENTLVNPEILVESAQSTVEPKPELNARVITITSGKGGVGKTNFAVNLAIQMSKQNKRVILIDADFGLANVEVMFGLLPKYTFANLLEGSKKVEEVLTDGPSGIKFISGGSGLSELANITDLQMSYIIESFAFLDSSADIILIDTGAGISKSVINFVKASNETVVITTPEPTSITDAYAVIKAIKEDGGGIPDIKVVVNRIDDAKEGDMVFQKLSLVSSKFLDISLKSLGSIPYDNHVVKAVKKQEPVINSFPNSQSARAIENIGRNLLYIDTEKAYPQDGLRSFMRKLVNIFGN